MHETMKEHIELMIRVRRRSRSTRSMRRSAPSKIGIEEGVRKMVASVGEVPAGEERQLKEASNAKAGSSDVRPHYHIISVVLKFPTVRSATESVADFRQYNPQVLPGNKYTRKGTTQEGSRG
jgi:hypothetical protein